MPRTGGGEPSPKHRVVGAIVVVLVGFVLLSSMLKDEENTEHNARPGTLAVRDLVTLEPTASTPPALREMQAPPDAGSAGQAPSALEQMRFAPADDKAAVADDTRQGARTREPQPPRAPAGSAEEGGWIVQVGAFSNSTNAQRLRQELQQSGYPVSLDNVELKGSKAVRVRVGPFRERQLAQEAQAKIESQTGLRGVVIAYP